MIKPPEWIDKAPWYCQLVMLPFIIAIAFREFLCLALASGLTVHFSYQGLSLLAAPLLALILTLFLFVLLDWLADLVDLKD